MTMSRMARGVARPVIITSISSITKAVSRYNKYYNHLSRLYRAFYENAQSSNLSQLHGKAKYFSYAGLNSIFQIDFLNIGRLWRNGSHLFLTYFIKETNDLCKVHKCESSVSCPSL